MGGPEIAAAGEATATRLEPPPHSLGSQRATKLEAMKRDAIERLKASGDDYEHLRALIRHVLDEDEPEPMLTFETLSRRVRSKRQGRDSREAEDAERVKLREQVRNYLNSVNCKFRSFVYL